MGEWRCCASGILVRTAALPSTTVMATAMQARWPLTHLQEGFMFVIFNPKARLFFAALMPQCIDRRPIGMQNLPLIFSSIWQIACTCFMAYALAGVAIRKILGKVFGLS